MLTERELEVLRRRARGERQESIATALKISQAAVSKFERNGLRKIVEAKETLDLAKEVGIQLVKGRRGSSAAYRGGRR